MIDHISTLRQYNAWRRGESIPMLDPKDVGEALDIAILEMESLKTLRALIDECAPIIVATAKAEHLLDGFRPQRRRLDGLAERVQAVAK